MKSLRFAQLDKDRDEIQEALIDLNFSLLFTKFHGHPEGIQSGDAQFSYILLTFFPERCFPAIIHDNVQATDFVR